MGSRPYWPRPAPSGPRFPLAPLLAAVGDDDHTRLAALVGVTDRQVRRAVVDGLNPITADRWAVANGLHPSTVWSNWWTVTVDV